MKKHIKILFIIFAFSLFTFAFLPAILNGTSASPAAGNWYQQFMPNPVGGQIRDIYFIDSLTGFAVSDSSILKTTTSGDSWNIKLTGYYIFNRIKFINSVTGFASGGNNTLLKTTNSGENWTPIILPSIYPFDMSVVSVDSIWLVNTNSLTGGIFRTTNGGGNWEQQLNLGSQNPGKIYMYNGRIGFASSTAGLLKTTNSGTNWNVISNDFAFSDMFFTDSLTGWKASGFVKKTTNGGVNWVNSPIPQGGNFLGNGANKFLNSDNDTIYAIGETIITGGNPLTRGVIFRTINGGNNWTYQVPDTAIHINRYLFGKLIGNHAWAYFINATGIHTTNGGDPVWLTGIEQISSEIPKDFKLYQNYPNPFNPVTNIKYSLRSNVKRQMSNVKLIVYDIAGREIIKLVDREQNAGIYKVDWNASDFASGVYFYRVEAEELDGAKFVDSKKMVLLK